MAIININYTEPKQSTYTSIELGYKNNGEDVVKLFDYGNIIIDYYDFMLFLQNQTDVYFSENPYIVCSSSFDHFLMDGNKYNQSYFDPETGEFMDWRKALKEKNYQLYNDIVNNGKYPNVIHLSCHKNFNIFKKYYKKYCDK